jgi:hypothetical protein
MNVMTEVHPYLDGKPKRMLIGGKCVAASMFWAGYGSRRRMRSSTYWASISHAA